MDTGERPGDDQCASWITVRRAIVRMKVPTVKARLQCSMFPRAALAIVVVNNQRPRLTASFKSFGDSRDAISQGLGRIMVMVKSSIDISALIIYRLRNVKTSF